MKYDIRRELKLEPREKLYERHGNFNSVNLSYEIDPLDLMK
jgi:hypothetical protein